MERNYLDNLNTRLARFGERVVSNPSGGWTLLSGDKEVVHFQSFTIIESRLRKAEQDKVICQ